LVQRFAADPQIAGDGRFGLTIADAAMQFTHLLVGQRALSTAICAALPGECNALTLPLFDQGSLKFGKGPHD
jgi:hypothetical protein